MTISYDKQVLIKRGNTASVSTYVGPLGELVLNTDTNQIFVHNGAIVGGTVVGDGEVNLSDYALTEDIPDVSNFITAEDIPFVPTDVADLTDNDSLLGGGGGTTVPSVDIASTVYKGFIARYGRVYDNSNSNELTVSKIVIYRQSAYIGSGSTIHPTSSEDGFAVTGLGPSDVVAMFVLYGDANGAKSIETLTAFVEAAVDSVLLAGGVEGEDNTIEDMRAAFYTNINTLTAAAGGLVANFAFHRESILSDNTPLTGGTGSGFVVGSVEKSNSTGVVTLFIDNNGTGYTVGDEIIFPGNLIDRVSNVGTTPENDVVITVTQVEVNGSVTAFTFAGDLTSILYPINHISDGGRDQYDGANYINTNLATQISYNGGAIVQDATPQFGAGSKYVVVYDASIFGILATGSSATTIGTSGNSGADGASTTDTGGLQRTGFLQSNAVTELTIVTGPLTFPDGTEQTTAFSRVKSTAAGSRRIEEVVGYSEVVVTERTTETYAGQLARTTDINFEIYVTRTFELQEVVAPIWNGDVNGEFEISLDGGVTYTAVFLASLQETEIWFSTNTGMPIPQVTGDAVSIRITSGGDSVIWWNKSELPGGSSNFRGAVIDYHAWTGESTIIGTIHIVDDDGEDHITHTEVTSGEEDGMNDNLWIVTTEGRIRYARFDGETKTLKAHWTAKVFYGSESYD